MGQTQLENKTRSAATERRRVVGRAAVATKKIGGRDVSRLAIWSANAVEESRLHRRDNTDARAGHWRQRVALFGGQRRADQSAALPAARAARDARPKSAEFRNRRHSLSEFS